VIGIPTVAAVRRAARRLIDEGVAAARRAPLSRREIERRLTAEFNNGPAYTPDFAHPTTYNEKIQWLKLHWRDPLITRLADKYAVRSYVEERVGGEVLVDLLGVWDSPHDIDFDALPEKFVLKATNGSGTNIICTDRSTADVEEYRGRLVQWMRPQNNHYFYSYEWQYKHIRPRVIAERYIDSFDDAALIDYKFHCFDGEPRIVMVCSERFSSGGLRIDYFTPEWEHLPFKAYYENAATPPARPELLAPMLDIARRLSAGLAHVRVDLYEIEGRVMFGELTFSSGSGMWQYTPQEWDVRMGEMMRLPEGPELRGRHRTLADGVGPAPIA
jgi:hypothetical protein